MSGQNRPPNSKFPPLPPKFFFLFLKKRVFEKLVHFSICANFPPLETCPLHLVLLTLLYTWYILFHDRCLVLKYKYNTHLYTKAPLPKHSGVQHQFSGWRRGFSRSSCTTRRKLTGKMALQTCTPKNGGTVFFQKKNWGTKPTELSCLDPWSVRCRYGQHCGGFIQKVRQILCWGMWRAQCGCLTGLDRRFSGSF